MRFRSLLLSAALLPAPAFALEIALPPNAAASGDETLKKAAFALPVAPFKDGAVRSEEIIGPVVSNAWTFPIGAQTTADIMNAQREKVLEAGYTPLLDCEGDRCGGFDFRYEMTTLPEPQMHVDLGDFRFLSAVRDQGEQTQDYIQIVVSRSPSMGFVQLTRLAEADEANIFTTTKTPDLAEAQIEAEALTLTDHLLDHGFARLLDLQFESGSAELGGGEFASLKELGAFLRQNPDITVALVGHTDAVGGLAANVSLSKRRAQSVLSRLVSDYGIARSRLEADGVGYLSPITTNQTEDGRLKNRRVEVVITSTR